LSALSDRIRGIVAPGTPGPAGAGIFHTDPAPLPPPPDLPGLSGTLGGEWRAGCFVVERRWEPSARHGREAIGTLAQRFEEAAGDAVLYAGGAPACAPFVFFDLETTGLSGGAGTQAFLVGCGWFEAGGSFVTRQFLLTKYADERALLETVAAEMARAGALVSFNGKSFDAPLLETRYLFHRLVWNGRQLPHLDVLHPARRFWKRGGGTDLARTDDARAFQLSLAGNLGSFGDSSERHSRQAGGGSSCSLTALERDIVGARRTGDIPGFEIPARYFQFVRSGDARPLVAVLEHNRLDLLALAALTTRLLHLTRSGPDAARDAREALGLGHVYERGACDERARTAYRCAIERCRSPRTAYDPIRIEALRSLALAWRRARCYEEAAATWGELLAIRGCPPQLEREATSALAIHHEHRRRDPAAAKTFALRSLEAGQQPVWRDAVQHRLARLERKLATQSLKAGRSQSLNF